MKKTIIFLCVIFLSLSLINCGEELGRLKEDITDTSDGSGKSGSSGPIGFPWVTTFNLTSPALTSSTSITFTLDGSDDNLAESWLVTESATPPLVGDAWSLIIPTGFTLSGGDGPKVVYAWVKDNDDNISVITANSFFTVNFDQTAPDVFISSSESDPTGTTPFSVTINFSEEVSGFFQADLTLVNGTVATFVPAVFVLTLPVMITVDQLLLSVYMILQLRQ